MVVADGPVGLVAAQVSAGRSDFRSAVYRVDGDDGQRGNAGVAFPDERGSGLQMEVI